MGRERKAISKGNEHSLSGSCMGGLSWSLRRQFSCRSGACEERDRGLQGGQRISRYRRSCIAVAIVDENAAQEASQVVRWADGSIHTPPAKSRIHRCHK